MPPDDPVRSTQQPEWTWTPRALKVVATARAIASPNCGIKADDILLAIEAVASDTGDHPASKALAALGIRPSAALNRAAPEVCPPSSFVSWEAFDHSLSGIFPALVYEEARSLGSDHIGTEHLLLFLARSGVRGVDLPYECIRQTVVELSNPS